MGRRVRLHDVIDVVDHVLRVQEYLGSEIAKRNMQHQRVVLEQADIGDVGRRSNGREENQITAPHKLRSEEHTSELQSPYDLVCRLLLEKKKHKKKKTSNNQNDS